MATKVEPRPRDRNPLTRERVLRAAVELADRGGLEAFTMRGLAHELGAEAMSLYYHVANKEAVLDGVLDVVMDEINVAVSTVEASGDGRLEGQFTGTNPCRPGGADPSSLGPSTDRDPHVHQSGDDALLRRPARRVARRLLIRPGPSRLARSRQPGLGFTQELFEPENADEADEEMVEAMAAMADQFPHLTGMMIEVASRRSRFDPGMVRRPVRIRVRAGSHPRRPRRDAADRLDQPPRDCLLLIDARLAERLAVAKARAKTR